MIGFRVVILVSPNAILWPRLRPLTVKGVVRTGKAASRGLVVLHREVVGVGDLYPLIPSPVGLLQHGIGDIESALG